MSEKKRPYSDELAERMANYARARAAIVKGWEASKRDIESAVKNLNSMVKLVLDMDDAADEVLRQISDEYRVPRRGLKKFRAWKRDSLAAGPGEGTSEASLETSSHRASGDSAESQPDSDRPR